MDNRMKKLTFSIIIIGILICSLIVVFFKFQSNGEILFNTGNNEKYSIKYDPKYLDYNKKNQVFEELEGSVKLSEFDAIKLKELYADTAYVKDFNQSNINNGSRYDIIFVDGNYTIVFIGKDASSGISFNSKSRTSIDRVINELKIYFNKKLMN